MTTIAERAYMSKAAELGCAICRLLGYGYTPAEIHHQRTGTGAGKRGKHTSVVPLCPEHHRGNTGIHGMGRKAFERRYGVTELWLIDQTRKLVQGVSGTQESGSTSAGSLTAATAARCAT